MVVINILKWLNFLEVKKDLKILKKNDEIKNKYCEKNNLKLLRIPYYDLKNIEIILSEFLK